MPAHRSRVAIVLARDPAVRRAALRAVPPVARLAAVVGRRLVLHRLEQVEAAAETTARRALPPILAGGLAVGIALALRDSDRRQSLRRLAAR